MSETASVIRDLLFHADLREAGVLEVLAMKAGFAYRCTHLIPADDGKGIVPCGYFNLTDRSHCRNCGAEFPDA